MDMPREPAMQGCLLRLANLPAWALDIVGLLEAAGFSAYIVGGAVRDCLLGRPLADIDIATAATPGQSTACFEAAGLTVHQTGTRHGTVTVVVQGHAMEVTTFRIDGAYSDARHPDDVRMAASIGEDLARRDFTVNAIAFNPRTGIVDPYDGQAALARRTICCVGDPQRRFSEDALRIMRALRFSAQLGFSIEPGTSRALLEQRGLLDRISRERIGKELCGIVCAERPGRVLGDYTDVFVQIIPEIAGIVGLDTHSPRHCHDVWMHTLVALDALDSLDSIGSHDLATRMATLFHDIGKAVVDDPSRGDARFAGHAQASAQICRRRLAGFAMPKKTINEACAIIEAHDVHLDPTIESVSRALGRLGASTLFKTLDLKRADILAHAPEVRGEVARIDRIEDCARQVLDSGRCFTVAGLAIDGNDLVDCSIGPGPQVGRVLHQLLELVITDACPNEPQALMAAARGIAR